MNKFYAQNQLTQEQKGRGSFGAFYNFCINHILNDLKSNRYSKNWNIKIEINDSKEQGLSKFTHNLE